MDVLLTIGVAIVGNAPYLVGFILPPFVELLNKDVKNDNERFIVSLLVCLLVAVGLHWNDIAKGSPDQALLMAGVIFTECTAIFKLYFANSWLREQIQKKLTKGEGVDNTIASPNIAVSE